MATISPVVVPYSGAVPGGVRRGMKIEIQGTVPQTATQWFSVNLCQGPQKEPNTVLHFIVRLYEQAILLNHMENNSWGPEERAEGQPFQKGKPFNLRIKVKPNIFKVKVDGRRVAVFDHRLPKETAKFIVIEGEVAVDFIKFTGGRGGGEAQSAVPDNPPINNPQIPFTTAIPGGLAPGRVIYISGVPHPKPARFTINLQNGVKDDCDVAMHFDARFHYGDSDNEVICNTFKDGNWGERQRDAPSFPFKPNEKFEIVIRVEAKAFKVEVNNQPFVEYKHRLPIEAGNTLKIFHDVKITQIRFE